ncbi:MAG: TM2 domain-containing protein [Clostridia bacterium]|nr:TM2 domain-containing protein [Clostridia bacterium]
MAKERKAPVMEPLEGDKTQAQRLMELDYEKQAAQIEAGGEEKTYGVWGAIWRFFKALDKKKGRYVFNKKTYLILLLLTGWMGGHRYYQGRRKLALLYTLFCWTGVPLALCITDLMEIIPVKADGDGKVRL